MVLVLIDYLIGSSWWRDDWSSRMTTRERCDDLASNGFSTSDSGLSSNHIIKPNEHEGYLSYKIRCHPPVVSVEASIIS